MRKTAAALISILLVLQMAAADTMYVTILPDGTIYFTGTNSIQSVSFTPSSPKTGDNITVQVATIDARNLTAQVTLGATSVNYSNATYATFNEVNVSSYSAGDYLSISIYACSNGDGCDTGFVYATVGSSIGGVSTNPATPAWNNQPTSLGWTTHLPMNSSLFWELNNNGTWMSVEDSAANTSHAFPVGNFSKGDNIKYYLKSCTTLNCERNPVGTSNSTFFISGCGDSLCDSWETYSTCPADCTAPSGPTGGSPGSGSSGGPSGAFVPLVTQITYNSSDMSPADFLDSNYFVTLESYLGKTVDKSATLAATDALLAASDLTMTRKITAAGSKSTVNLTLTNKDGTLSDFVLVETAPKSAASNIGKLSSFSPAYSQILEADPIFAYYITRLPKGTRSFSYSVDKVVGASNGYAAPVLMTLRFEQPPPPQSRACGNGLCEAGLGEDCTTCNEDCGPCPKLYCGDYLCSNGETCSTCTQDCGPCAAAPQGLARIAGFLLQPTVLMILAILVLSIVGYAYVSYSREVERDLLHTDAHIQAAKRILIEAPPLRRAVAQQYVEIASQKMSAGQFDEARLHAMQAMREAGATPTPPTMALDRELTSAERMMLIKKSVERLAKATQRIKERY